MKNDILFEKYQQLNEIALNPRFQDFNSFVEDCVDEVQSLFNKYCDMGMPFPVALKKAVLEIQAKHKAEKNKPKSEEDESFRANDEDVPDGPL